MTTRMTSTGFNSSWLSALVLCSGAFASACDSNTCSSSSDCAAGEICNALGECAPQQVVPVVDAGFRDAARPDSSTGQDAALPAAVFDPAEVYLVGTLTEGTTGGGVMFKPETPDSVMCCVPDVGAGLVGRNAAIRPSDGALLYGLDEYPDPPSVRKFVPDAFSWNPDTRTGTIPDRPEANDPVVVQCAAGTRVNFFVAPDTSKVVYQCANGDPWQIEGGGALTVPTGCTSVEHVGFGSAFACSNGVVNSAGVYSDLSASSTSLAGRYLRATATGFSTVDEDGAARQHTPIAIALDGTVTTGTPYPAVGTDVSFVNAPVLGWLSATATGAVYRWYLDPDDSADDLIARETATGYQIVYRESDARYGKFHSSFFVTGP